ncbi:MAG: hypothetical protein ABI797_05550 [Chloroflexota bacterium]
MGPLEDVDPPIDVYARWVPSTEAERSAGAPALEGWWSFPYGPVDGLLLLSVANDGQVEFLGWVRWSPGFAQTYSAAQAGEITLSSFALDSVVLVDGWLGGQGGAPPCPYEEAPITGLLARGCVHPSWISDDAASGGADALRVQNDAYFDFAPNHTSAESFVVESRRGVYALARRLFGSGCTDAQVPCWGWAVVARVDGPSAVQPRPSRSPFPTATLYRQSLDCGLATLTFVDETGLVRQCTATQSPGEAIPFALAPDDDRDTLEVSWSGIPACDGPQTLSFKVLGEGVLKLDLHSDPIMLCDGVPWETHVFLELWGPLSPTTVIALHSTSPRPSPTANPPAVDITHACTSTDSATDRVVELTDHAGLIESCSTRLVDWPGQQFVISDVSRGVVRIAFEDGCAGAGDARLDLWDRGDDSPAYEPRYFLNVELQRPVSPLGCHDAMAGIAVDITFMNVELAPGSLASSIETSLMVDGRGMASFESADAARRFTLEIGAGKSEYAQNEAIKVSALLTSETDVTVVCMSGPIIALEQLDGSLQFAPGPFILLCPGPRELQGGEPVTSEFAPEAWGLSDPNPLTPYLRDGELYLPNGTYRFFARASFWVGELLEDDRVELEASVVVRVGGFVDSGPILHTPSPTASPDPNLTNRERIDLYWSSSGSVECMGMNPPTSLSELAGWSDLIVIGRPISVEPWADPEALPARWTITFEISDVLRGAPDDAHDVVQVLISEAPRGDVSDIDHVLILSHHNNSAFYLTGGFMSIYANVDIRVMTPEYDAIKRRYGNHIFSTALDGTRFEKLVERLRDAGISNAQRSWQEPPQRGLFAC